MLIIILIVAGGILVMYYWLVPEIDLVVTENGDVRSRYETLLGAEYDLSRMESNLAKIEADIPLLQESLPPLQDVFKVIDQLEKIAAEVGLTQTVEVSDQTVSDGERLAVPVNVQLRGSKGALEEYLKRLENLRYFIQEKGLEYDLKYTITEEGGKVEDGINAQLELLIYLQPS